MWNRIALFIDQFEGGGMGAKATNFAVGKGL